MKKLSFKTSEHRVLFTADLHFSHGKDFILKPRGYASLQEAMDHTRKTLYDTLKPDDVLFNLGDAVVGAGENSLRYATEITNLPCRHQYFIFGNHNAGMQQIYDTELQRLGLAADDVELYPLTLPNGRFTFLGHYAEIYVNRRPVVLAHYPIASWNHLSKGGWMLHGHCHRNLKDDPSLHRLDVGWDWKKRPVAWDEIEREMAPRKTKAVDHHSAESEFFTT